MHDLLLWLAVGFYGLSVVLTLPSVSRRRPVLSPAALGALGLGLLAHGVALGGEAVRLGRPPVADVRSALSFYAFLVTLAFLFAYLRYRIVSLGLFMLPLVFLFTLLSVLHPPGRFDSGALRGGWLLVHTGSIFLGYTALFLTFVAAVMYLIQERELKSKQPRGFYYRLPSLEVCDKLHYRSLVLGLPCLSLGLLTGFVWATRAWKGPWGLDPKVVASLATWVIYLVLFSTRVSGAWRGRRAAYLAILGFAAILVTFVGASLLSGLHGYVPKLGAGD